MTIKEALDEIQTIVEFCDNITSSEIERFNKNMNYIKKELKILEKKRILDNIEKEYLGNIIKPFRNKIKYIEKVNSSTRGSTLSFIFISLNTGEGISLPLFNSNKMYKNMISDKKYTIKKLGL